MYNFLSFLVVVSGADSFLLYLIWWIPTNHEFYASNRDWFQLFNQLLSFTSQTQEFLYIFMSTQKSTICFLVCSPSRQKKNCREGNCCTISVRQRSKRKYFFFFPQLNKFRKLKAQHGGAPGLMCDNIRPVQPLYKRKVYSVVSSRD